MSASKSKKSPFKCFKAVQNKNQSHCGFVSMSQLDPNKAYMVMDLKPTSHEKYGDGLLSFLKGRNDSSWRSQFPPKYLASFTSEDVSALREEIDKKNYPFLIFREVLMDKSFKIDLAPHSAALLELHKKWLDVGEIILSPDSSLNDSDAADAGNVDSSHSQKQKTDENEDSAASPTKKLKLDD